MLVDILSLIPKGRKVYVLFDSWYSSAKLIEFRGSEDWILASETRISWSIIYCD